METITKKEETKQRALSYLNKTAKHLFVTENGNFFKVLPFKYEGTWYYLKMEFGGDKLNTLVNEIISDKYYHGGNTLYNFKRTFFPEWTNRTAIPNFRAMREKMFEILKLMQKEFDGTKECMDILKPKIARILDGIEVQK